jgi:MFS family permease
MHMSSYKEVVRTGGWARPLATSLIGRVPESMISVTLVLLVHQSTDSYVSAGLATAAFGLGSALAAPVAGRGLDRLGHRPMLISLALTFAGVLVAIVVSAGHLPVDVTIALASLAGLTRPPLESAMRALWATIVAAGHLHAVYVLDAIGQDLIWIAGPLLLSALLLIGGPSSALLACAACSALGSIGYATTPAVPQRRADHHTPGPHPRLHSPALSSLLAAAGLYGVAMGAFEIALIAFCADHHAKPAVGVLLAVWSVGSILGGLVYGAHTWGTPPAPRAIALLAALAVLLALLNLAASVTTLAALLFAMGLPTAPFTGTLSATVQTLVPPQRAAEGFTWITAMITTGIAIGNAAAGPLTQTHPHLGFPLAATAAAAGATLGLAGRRLTTRVR